MMILHITEEQVINEMSPAMINRVIYRHNAKEAGDQRPPIPGKAPKRSR